MELQKFMKWALIESTVPLNLDFFFFKLLVSVKELAVVLSYIQWQL